MIFVNFKTYEQGTGASALELAEVIQGVVQESHIKIIPVVQVSDLKEITQAIKLEVWVQSIDPIDYGAHTGAVLPEAVLEDGASGTFLNHSEKKFKSSSDLRNTVKRAGEVGLKTLVFAQDIKELRKVIDFKPTFVSYEPPELVGSKTTSVAEEKPEIISKAVEISREEGIPLVVGAGIKSSQDVKRSVELGAVGVAVASDIVLAKDPKKELMDLVEGFEG
jgi:triosephosphate isomerase